MSKLFSPDSIFMRAMTVLANLLLLNLLSIVCSLPLFTIGAAVTALYTVINRMLRGEDPSIIKEYFISFKNSFKQATLMWLPMLLCAAMLVFNFAFFGGGSTALSIAVIIIVSFAALILTFVYCWTFPLYSQFENTKKATVINAFFLSVGHLPLSLLMAALTLLPWALLYLSPATFIRFIFLWVALWFSFSAYLIARLQIKSFANLRKNAGGSASSDKD